MRLVCEPCVCSGGSSTPPTPMCLFSSGTSLEHPAAWPEPRRAERVLFFSRTVGATTRVGGSSRKEEPHGEEPSGWVSHGSCVRRVSYLGSSTPQPPSTRHPPVHGLHATSNDKYTLKRSQTRPLNVTHRRCHQTPGRRVSQPTRCGWGAWLRPRTSSAPARPIQAA